MEARNNNDIIASKQCKDNQEVMTDGNIPLYNNVMKRALLIAKDQKQFEDRIFNQDKIEYKNLCKSIDGRYYIKRWGDHRHNTIEFVPEKQAKELYESPEMVQLEQSWEQVQQLKYKGGKWNK